MKISKERIENKIENKGPLTLEEGLFLFEQTHVIGLRKLDDCVFEHRPISHYLIRRWEA